MKTEQPDKAASRAALKAVSQILDRVGPCGYKNSEQAEVERQQFAAMIDAAFKPLSDAADKALGALESCGSSETDDGSEWGYFDTDAVTAAKDKLRSALAQIRGGGK